MWTAAHGAAITAIEAVSRGASSILLLGFSAFYRPEDYAILLPWLACQQLIVTFAPFGASDVLAKLINTRGLIYSADLYAYIPRYVGLNLLFAVPVSWLLTWVATRHLVTPSFLDSTLILLSGIWMATQRTRQQFALLTGAMVTFTSQKIISAAVHIGVSLTLVVWHTSILTAFFCGQVAGLAVAECIRPPVSRALLPPQSLYWEIFRQGWVFGLWSFFGWFSGLGAVILLTHVTGSNQIAGYGQALAIVGLMGLGLGGLTLAIQSKLVQRQTGWSYEVQKRIFQVYNLSIAATFALCGLASLAHAQDWAFLQKLGIHWPSYIWIYFGTVYCSLTLYQRTMIRYCYDSNSSLPWGAVVLTESLALAAFALALKQYPNEPLWANAALIGVRCVSIFSLAKFNCFGMSFDPSRTPSAPSLVSIGIDAVQL